MTEVSAWNAVDASNSLTPPDGWPEGQQPSSVNDCGRMMMGALRREHDRITAQIGSVAGTISTTTINATTVNTTGAITASGPITGSAINSTGNGSIAGTLNAGTVTVSGTVQAGQLTSTGNLNIGGGVNVSGGITSGATVTAAQLTSTGNANVAGTISAGGFTTAGNINASGAASITGDLTAGHLKTAGGDMFMGPGGSGRQLQMASGWYWDFNPSTGDLIWGGPSGAQFWVTRFSDHYCGNQIGPVFGNGAYINFSDVRGKTDISPAPQGLSEILRLKPVTFKRTDSDHDELGFTAQDVQEILPEAVRSLSDGDGADRLGVTLDPIVATLVHAVQQLAARIEQLEAGETDV
jgi:hypothetical protein